MRITKLSMSEMKALRTTLGSFLIAKDKTISPMRTRVSDQINKLNAIYMRVIRLDELKLSQDKVNTYQERLLEAQTNRRDISIQLTNIRHESNGLHTQISEAKRTENDDRYIELVRLERELKRKENTISDQLQHVDKLERDLFNALTNAIRDSHVTQRAQAEYTKYFSIILSIFGSFASFLFFMVRKEELKEFIEKKLEVLDANNKVRDDNISEKICVMTEKINLHELAKISEIVSMPVQNQRKTDPVFANLALDNANEITEKNFLILKYCGIAIGAWLILKIFT